MTLARHVAWWLLTAVGACTLGCGSAPREAAATAGPPSAPQSPGGVAEVRIEPPPKPAPKAPEPAASAAGAERAARPEAADDDEDASGREDRAPSQRRAWLGVELKAVQPGQPGVELSHVVPQSPAAAAGLSDGEMILQIDGRVVASPSDVVRMVSARRPGSTVAVMARGHGGDRPVRVTLGAFPDREQLYRMRYVGQPAPAFDGLVTARGSMPAQLSAYRGKVVVVEFWASWCMVCRAMVPVLNDWQARLSARGMEVVGVTEDPVATAAQHAAGLGMGYATFSDAGGKTTAAYRASALPTLFVVDRTGVVRDVVVGYDSRRLRETEQLLSRLVAQP